MEEVDNNPTKESDILRITLSEVLPGITSAASQSILFNPWDRGNFLAISEKRRLLDRRNFSHPFRGTLSNFAGRLANGGLYFSLMERGVKAGYDPALSGASAGAVTAIVTNPHAMVKYRVWGSPEKSFVDTARRIPWQNFSTGVRSRIARDVVFSAIFSSCHFRGDKEYGFAVDVASSFAGTVFAAPFNYVMNHQYAGDARSSLDILGEWARGPNRAARLHIGWGTTRVALGMSVGINVFELAKTQFQVFFKNGG